MCVVILALAKDRRSAPPHADPTHCHFTHVRILVSMFHICVSRATSKMTGKDEDGANHAAGGFQSGRSDVRDG